MSFANLIHTPIARGRSPFSRDTDRLFDSLFAGFPASGSPLAPTRTPAFVPNIAVEKTDEGYAVSAELPGFGPDEFEVVVEDGSLTLKGAKSVEVGADDADSEGVETKTYKEFERRFRLGEEIDVDAVEARYSNGLLTVSLPKVVEQKTVRAIPVTTSA